MSYYTIHTTLDNRLQTVTGLPTLQQENVRKVGDKKLTEWCRSTLLPSKTVVETVGLNGYNKVFGQYQIDIFYPQDISYTLPFQMGDTILHSFIIGTVLSGINITNSYILSGQSFQGSNQVPGYYKLIVMIEWVKYEQRPTI
jgi:hypothetical protein